jgi:hypothetical protein
MRILNIIFNAKIKYQQHAKLIKFIDIDFCSNFDPGKTHKGKTSERGIFIIIELLRNFFYSSLIFSKKYKLISENLCSSSSENSRMQLLKICTRNPYNCTAAIAINAVRNSSKIVPLFCV